MLVFKKSFWNSFLLIFTFLGLVFVLSSNQQSYASCIANLQQCGQGYGNGPQNDSTCCSGYCADVPNQSTSVCETPSNCSCINSTDYQCSIAGDKYTTHSCPFTAPACDNSAPGNIPCVVPTPLPDDSCNNTGGTCADTCGPGMEASSADLWGDCSNKPYRYCCHPSCTAIGGQCAASLRAGACTPPPAVTYYDGTGFPDCHGDTYCCVQQQGNSSNGNTSGGPPPTPTPWFGYCGGSGQYRCTITPPPAQNVIYTGYIGTSSNHICSINATANNVINNEGYSRNTTVYCCNGGSQTDSWGTCSWSGSNGVCNTSCNNVLYSTNTATTACEEGADTWSYQNGYIDRGAPVYCVCGGQNGSAACPNISISGHIYVDKNSNGQYDSGEGVGNATLGDGSTNTTSASNGSYSFTGLANNGNYTITLTIPAGYILSSTNPVTLNNVTANQTVDFVLTQRTVSGNVFQDFDHNGNKDSGVDQNFPGIGVSDGFETVTTDANGNYSFPQTAPITTQNVTITVNVPNSAPQIWQATTTNPVTVDPEPSKTVNFGLTPLYQISGIVYNDANKDKKYDSGDTPITFGPTISIQGPVVSTPTADTTTGLYTTGQTLLSGVYTVTYASTLPAGYAYVANSAYQVTVGTVTSTCSVGGSTEATCGDPLSGSVNNLNFGLTNENSHIQTECMDWRVDNNNGGVVNNLMPAPGATCGGVNGSLANLSDGSCSTGSGIVYSCNGTFDFGQGSANANNWQAGGTNQECFAPPGINNIRLSYEYLQTTAQQSNITPTDMNGSSVCGAGGIADCTLNTNLPKGIYIANGNLNLEATTIPSVADPNNDYASYIFLIHGNLTINGNILIPQGSTAVFATSGNIEVSSSVGQDASDTTNPAINTPNLEGIYSADANFLIDSISSTNGGQLCQASGLPWDKKLNIVGSVITDANNTGTGQFINNRDLCSSDTQCPSVSTGDGLQYLLPLLADGQFVLRQNFNWQEIKP